jgi:hypothetical protein
MNPAMDKPFSSILFSTPLPPHGCKQDTTPRLSSGWKKMEERSQSLNHE